MIKPSSQRFSRDKQRLGTSQQPVDSEQGQRVYAEKKLDAIILSVFNKKMRNTTYKSVHWLIDTDTARFTKLMLGSGVSLHMLTHCCYGKQKYCLYPKFENSRNKKNKSMQGDEHKKNTV